MQSIRSAMWHWLTITRAHGMIMRRATTSVTALDLLPFIPPLVTAHVEFACMKCFTCFILFGDFWWCWAAADRYEESLQDTVAAQELCALESLCMCQAAFSKGGDGAAGRDGGQTPDGQVRISFRKRASGASCWPPFTVRHFQV